MPFQFDNLYDFFEMGGYAAYVWSSWILCLLVVAYLLLSSWIQRRRIRNNIRLHLKRQQYSAEERQT